MSVGQVLESSAMLPIDHPGRLKNGVLGQREDEAEEMIGLAGGKGFRPHRWVSALYYGVRKACESVSAVLGSAGEG